MNAAASPRALMALALVLLAGLGAAWVFADRLSLDALAEGQAALQAWRAAHGPRAAAGFFAATTLAALVSLPGIAVFTLAGGLLFGAVWGTLLTAGAATLGALVPFLLARAGVGETLWRRLEAGRAQSFALELKRNEVKALLILRLAPVVPFLVANVLPGLMGVTARRYLVTTFFGLLPGTAAIALAGGALAEIAASGGQPGAGPLALALTGPPLAILTILLAVHWLRR